LSPASVAARLAELAVDVGANVQRGQIVTIGAKLGEEEIVRELAAAAYRRGAKFVDVGYFDPHVKRARIQQAPDDTLDFVPPWYGERVRELGRARAARIVIASCPDPDALRDLDPDRLGRDQLPAVKEWMDVLAERTINWTIVPFPTAAWARLCHPDLDADAAFERLSTDILHVCRLDEDDPRAAWRARAGELRSAAARLNALELDSVRFRGPGTDLTVGLLPSASWLSGPDETVDGLEHMPNLPTEEVFTTPDPQRTEGRVRSTKPLVLIDGSVVNGLEVRFEQGRAVAVEAAEGAEVIRARIAQDEGAACLGEVALVDRGSRVGQLGTIFYETLLDENAVSHIAFGSGFDEAVPEDDLELINHSGIHIDFMVGGDDVDVTGTTRDGREVPLLLGGTWQT
jgi:aminopeptidase